MRMKDYSIYFGDNEVVVTTKSPNSQYAILDVDTSYAIPRAKIVKKVETDKFVAIVTPDTDATFDSLKSQFKVVLAAGGVVESDDEQLLMICLLYTSDAADDMQCVDLGGRGSL